MTQPYPGHQPYPPTPYGPPPPKKGMSTGAIVAIIIGGLFVLLILLVVVLGALVSTPETDDKGTPTAAPTAEQTTPPAKKPKAPAEKPPVQVVAKAAKFAPSILHDGGEFTSVAVTITNNSDETISINPLYFTITDKGGSKHTAQLGMDENQMGTVDLAPGENITGSITGKGEFVPKYVTYTDGLLGEGVRGSVS